jgi:hypothetical protein
MTKRERQELKHLADRLYAEATRARGEAGMNDCRIVVDCRVLDRLVELLDIAAGRRPKKSKPSDSKFRNELEDDISELEDKLKKYQTLPVLSF